MIRLPLTHVNTAIRSRCILEYRFYDQKGKLQRWYDVHPLVKDLERFGGAGDG